MIKIHFHLGQPKTGSSTIQRILKKNTHELAKKGYLYAPKGIDHQDTLYTIKSREDFRTFINDQIKKAKDLNCHNIIISDEALFFKDEDILLEWLEDIHENYYAYVYLKRQDTYLESSWKQWYFKDLSYRDFDDFLDKYEVKNYYYHLKKWLKFIKSENMHIKAFEKRNLEGGLERNFLHWIGIEDIDGFDFTIDDNDTWGENKGLTKEGLELAFEVRELAHNKMHDHKIQNFIGRYFSDMEKEHFKGYNLIPHEKRLVMIDEFNIINDRISKEIMGNDEKLFQDSIKMDKNLASEKITTKRIINALMTIGVQQDKMLRDMAEDIRQLKSNITSFTINNKDKN